MLDFDIMANDLDFIHSDVPHTFAYKGNTYTGSIGTTEIDVVYSEEGSNDGVEVTLIATVRAFASGVPADGELITYPVGGKEYRVISTRLDTAEVGISIELGDKYKK